MAKSRYFLIFILFLLCMKASGQLVETTYQATVIANGPLNPIPLTSDGPFPIGFNFTFYGNVYTEFWVSENGRIMFNDPASAYSTEVTIPTTDLPNNFIAPFWDNLVISSTGNILYTTIGAAPNRKLVVQYKNMMFSSPATFLGTFSVILYETSNNIQIQYRQIIDKSSALAHGSSATIGIENSDGTQGALHAFHNSAAVTSEQAILFTPGTPYTINPGAVYDGVYLTKNISLPDPGITSLLSPPQDAVMGTDITFQWGESLNASSYTLLVSTSPDLGGSAPINAGSSLSYNVTGLVTGNIYYWGVFAVNASGTTWCEIRRFSTSSTPPLAAVPQTNYVEQNQEKTINLAYTGGDGSSKTAIITTLPANGKLYQYNGGVKGTEILSPPVTVTDPGRNVIYAATGSTGNGAGNFSFKINDASGDSPAALVTINVTTPGKPNLLNVAKSTGVEIQFDLPMSDPAGKENQFTVTVNGTPAIINSASLKTGDPNSIVLSLATPLAGTETVLVSYTQGNVTGSTGGILLTFTDQAVTLTAQTITFTQSLIRKFNESPLTLTSTASSGLGITYSSSNLTVATASGNVLTFHGPGTSGITARQAGNTTYAPARYEKLLTVSMGDQTITFNVLPDKTTADGDFSPGATASSGLQVSYTSGNPAVATIIAGMIHIVGAGTAIITASQPGNINYNAAVDVSQPLTVSISTGFENNFISQKSFNIYPTDYQINIVPLAEEWNGKTGTVAVLDITGRIVSFLQNTEFRKNSIIQINAPATHGIYIVEIKSGVMKYTGKIVIK
jgi:hypothetical protein